MFHRTFFVIMYRLEKLCGCDVLTPDWKPHKYTIFWLLMNVSFCAFSFYTIATYDIETKWKCLTWVGLAFQGFIKFNSIIIYPREMRVMVNFLYGLYQANIDPTSANYRTLQKYAAMSLTIMKVGTFVVCSTCAIFTPITLLTNRLTDKREFALQSFLPGIDECDSTGYLITWLYHMAVLLLAATGTSAADMRLVLFVLHLQPMSEMFRNLMEDLNRALLVPRNRSSREVQTFFRNLVLVHLEFCSFLKLIGKIYRTTIFVEIYSDAIVLCFIQFCVLVVSSIISNI